MNTQRNGVFSMSQIIKKKTGIVLSVLFTSLSSVYAQSEQYLALADSADTYIAKENWKMAEKTLTSALRLEPGNASNVMLLSNLGVVRTRLRDYDGALQAFDVALAMSPKSKTVRINRARTYLETHEDEAAIEDINEVLRLDSLQDWSLRTRALLRLSQGKYKECKEDILTHQRHHPADADLLAAAGACAAAVGEYEEAIKWYDQSIDAKQNPETWFSRTLIKIQMKKYGEADEDIRRAIAIYPDFGNLYLLRAMLKKTNHLLTESDEDRKLALRKGASPELAATLLDNSKESIPKRK